MAEKSIQITAYDNDGVWGGLIYGGTESYSSNKSKAQASSIFFSTGDIKDYDIGKINSVKIHLQARMSVDNSSENNQTTTGNQDSITIKYFTRIANCEQSDYSNGAEGYPYVYKHPNQEKEEWASNSVSISTPSKEYQDIELPAGVFSVNDIKNYNIQLGILLATNTNHGATVTGYIKNVQIEIGYTLKRYKITVSVGSNNDTGTVRGGGTFELGKNTTIAAIPKDGYQFKKWDDNSIENKSPVRIITIEGNKKYKAFFEKKDNQTSLFGTQIFKEPTLVLMTKSGKRYGTLKYYNLVLSDDLNNGASCSFDVYKYNNPSLNTQSEAHERTDFANTAEKTPFWDYITNGKIIWISELNMLFEIEVSLRTRDSISKSISGTLLGKSELNRTMIFSTEINTEDDIAREDYVATKFYDIKNPDSSLLNRLFSKTPQYNVFSENNELNKIQRIYKFDNKTLNDCLSEISNDCGCLFDLNFSYSNGRIDRTIHAYNSVSRCQDCGYTGIFSGKCPACGADSSHISYPDERKDTGIYISKENIAQNVSLDIDNSSVKNCYHLEAGDSTITSMVRMLTPDGSGYLWNFDEILARDDLSDKLREKLEKYSFYYTNGMYRNILKLPDNTYTNDILSNFAKTSKKILEEVLKLFVGIRINFAHQVYKSVCEQHKDVLGNEGYDTKLYPEKEEDETSEKEGTVTVNSNTTDTATSENTVYYLSFDSIFNFKRWYDSGIKSGHNVTVNATDTSVTVTSTDSGNDGYTSESPLFPVNEGESYTINADVDGSGYEIFIFYHTGTASWSSLNSTTSLPYTFTVPSGINNISIRLDANANGNIVTFSNIRIYPSNYSYMGNTLNSSERYLRSTDTFLLPTPTRKGFNFEGWFTQPKGGKRAKITSVPNANTVLYSHWTKSKVLTLKDAVCNYYNFIDLKSFIDDVMLPVKGFVSTTDAETEAHKLFELKNDKYFPVESLNNIGFSESEFNNLTAYTVARRIELLSKLILNPSYIATCDLGYFLTDNSKNSNQKFFKSKITVRYVYSSENDKVNTKINDDYTTETELTFTVTNDNESYIKSQLSKILAENLKDKYSITGLFNLSIDGENSVEDDYGDYKISTGNKEWDETDYFPDMNYRHTSKFWDALQNYNLNELNNIEQACNACVTVLTEMGTDDVKKIKEDYDKRLELIERQIKKIQGYGVFLNEGIKTYRYIIDRYHKSFNLKNYFGDELYKELLIYRKDDDYSNSNYISEGLTNYESLQKTTEFLNKALQSLTLTGSASYNISANVYNLLAMKEFEGLLDNFAVGNWIRVGLEDNDNADKLLSSRKSEESITTISSDDEYRYNGVKKMILTHWEINYNDIENIQVEFKNVEDCYRQSGITNLATGIARMINNTTNLFKRFK